MNLKGKQVPGLYGYVIFKMHDKLIAKNATELLQVVNFTGLLQLINKLQQTLSIFSSCKKSVKIGLVATCHLQTCYNLLAQLVEAYGEQFWQTC